MDNTKIFGAKNLDSPIYKLIASFLLAVIMGVFISLQCPSLNLANDKALTSVLFSLIYLVSLVVLCRIDGLKPVTFLFMSAGLAAVIFMRVSMLSVVSMDYYNFIQKWIETMSGMSFKQALVTKIGDYNLPYLYFLAILSRFKSGHLVAVKAFSCIFDVLCAYYVMKIVALKYNKAWIKSLTFVLTFAVPTLLLNSAYWGQCDAIYGALCIGSIYYAIRDNGTKSMLMFGLAFAFKLQSVFIVPILIVCFIVKKTDLYKLMYVPIVYIVCMMPAIICGRGIKESLFIYIDQASQVQYNKMTMNAPSVWQMFGEVSYDTFKWVGIMLAGLMAVVLIYLCYIHKDSITTSHLVTVAYLSVLLLPYFLPSMHDRYFFIADLLSVCVFFYDKRKWYVPIVTVMASFACYMVFLVNDPNVYNIRPFAVALLVVTVLVAKDFVTSLKNTKSVY